MYEDSVQPAKETNVTWQRFEDMGRENGMHFWWASDLMSFLGYESNNVVNSQPIQRAMTACNALSVPIHESFCSEEREIDGRKCSDFKLSRFACYLVAMNADPRKERVARVQVYFAELADQVQQYLEERESIDRVINREHITQQEKVLSGTAFRHGVENYALFQDAGYRGLYNKGITHLKNFKHIEGSLLDFMGSTELAANIFRISQTSQKIENENIRGQRPLENAAEKVGKIVRQAIKEAGGTMPEYLPAAEHINSVKKGLKEANRTFTKLDAPKKASKKKTS
jgi:DNA-damage-inducible protein D